VDASPRGVLPGVPGDGQGERGTDRRGGGGGVLGHGLLVGGAIGAQAGDRHVQQGEEGGVGVRVKCAIPTCEQVSLIAKTWLCAILDEAKTTEKVPFERDAPVLWGSRGRDASGDEGERDR